MSGNQKNLSEKIRKHIANTVGVSKDIILDTILIRVIGDSEIIVENYKGIIEYTDKTIRIKAKPRYLKISGDMLELRNISDEILCISGSIDVIVFIKNSDGDS